MNDLIPLHFETADIRMIIRNGVPWWAGIDVTAALGIVKAHQALATLEDYERGTYVIGTPSGDQEMIVINESGFYSLLFRSRKPIAVQFKRWLTCEVLPSIRQHGQYPPPADIDVAALPAPDAYQPSMETTPNGRLFEECRRVFGTDNVKALEHPLRGILSANQLRALALGGSVEKALTRNGAWASAAMLFDLQYLVFGIRSLTAQERAMRDMIRMLEPEQRAVTFARLSQQVDRLRALPAG